MAKKPGFEEAIQQLEAIAEQIESGTIGLEESITRYEEAMGLAQHCRRILEQAEARIQKLHLGADGETQGTEFEAPAEPQS